MTGLSPVLAEAAEEQEVQGTSTGGYPNPALGQPLAAAGTAIGDGVYGGGGGGGVAPGGGSSPEVDNQQLRGKSGEAGKAAAGGQFETGPGWRAGDPIGGRKRRGDPGGRSYSRQWSRGSVSRCPLPSRWQNETVPGMNYVIALVACGAGMAYVRTLSSKFAKCPGRAGGLISSKY